MSTISDVAREAGVSTATVSRYLRGHPVRAAQAIKRAIDELAYAPSAIAQSLKSGRTGHIGVVVPDITNPYFASAVRAIGVASRTHGYHLLLYDTDDNADEQTYALEALQGVIDGLILTPAIDSDGVPDALLRHGGPVVLLDREFSETIPCDVVVVDNFGGARQAAQYLVHIGHRMIGMIGGPLTCAPARMRHDGFRAGLQEAGIDVATEHLYSGDFRELGGYLAMKQLLAAEVQPTAVFVANNLMAMGALRACKEHRMRIPADLSFVSFDDLEHGDLLDPPITTVSRQSVREGQLAFSLIAQRLGHPDSRPPRRCILETRLSVRESCASPAPLAGIGSTADEVLTRGGGCEHDG